MVEWKADVDNAKATNNTGIVLTPKGMIRIRPDGTWEWVLTEDDWTEFKKEKKKTFEEWLLKKHPLMPTNSKSPVVT